MPGPWDEAEGGIWRRKAKSVMREYGARAGRLRRLDGGSECSQEMLSLTAAQQLE